MKRDAKKALCNNTPPNPSPKKKSESLLLKYNDGNAIELLENGSLNSFCN